MNAIVPDRDPVPSRRPLGIPWDAVFDGIEPGTPLPWGDAALAAVLGCARQAVGAARKGRGILPAPRASSALPVSYEDRERLQAL